MPSNPEAHATFTVTSGYVCFGGLHNIWSGSTAPGQSFVSVRAQTSGTVKIHKLEHNIVAKNGAWKAFRLIDCRNNGVCAWFISHSDVEPVYEIRRILRVSGSPYEPDSGSTMNDDNTQREGILVINRYDWGYYDSRNMDEVGEGVEEGENDVLANSNSAGLVDHVEAQRQVQQWKSMRPSERPSSQAGIWMYSPHAEYMFGRFGFNDARDAAHSFLLFSANTDFTQTSFEGFGETLRKYETPQERFERQLHENYDFSGIKELHKLSTPSNTGFPSFGSQMPADSELEGPHKNTTIILEIDDIERLRVASQKSWEVSRSKDFAGTWKAHIYDLLNELTWYYLDRYIRPHVHSRGTSEVAASAIFPRHSESGTNGLDYHLYRHFTQPDADTVSDFNADGVAERIKKFLPGFFDDTYPKRICRVVAYFITEILELASHRASDSFHFQIVPSDIRLSIYMDQDLFLLFQYSRVFWQDV